ncbi:P-loop containing nucleoside triphosphate hydrolase protein [Microdochium trichocladiopsis]|uniref:DNA 3'-5' helicase n=1 Tax=Microdochium trichocladiopsis TaxID=1682393 RepID=A0A9P8YJ19_9PEZI|nr:P-loop containing nucleoside triphosphate hydrolase protein [Microdochium trichocladiopsis]KAH7040276.1 P-loop containing nucleoside triphosphate hydrolase protein [Microdochium trichocladiopsis]
MDANSAGGGIFASLNKAQRRAVTSEASTVAILAGPGSGKTHTLTSRAVWLINHVGIPPSDVLVATFTVKAANEMRLRIGKALGGGLEKKIVLGTFHSIARRYLAAYGQRIGLRQNFGIADDSDSRGIITRICKRQPAALEPAMVRGWISKRKARGTSDDTTKPGRGGRNVESKALEECYQEYQAQLDRSNLLDYDDLLVRCVELLRKFPSCVSNIQAVLIDEYQDTNGIQYDLTTLFAQEKRRITIVGDPDQSIYGWRSAEIRNLHRLLRDYPGTDEVSLEENYRSSSSILDVSLKVIQQDTDRYKKALLPVHDRGTRPVLRHLRTSTDEADWIVSEVKRLQLMSGGMVELSDIAILLRSASLSRHIESALGRQGMAYRMVGGFKFYERAEVKTILDYLRIIHHPDNNDALARIINVPKRGVGDATIKSLLEEAERNSMSLWKLLVKHCRGERWAKTTIRKQTEQKISGELIRLVEGARNRIASDDAAQSDLATIIDKLLKDLKFEDYLKDSYPEHETRWANVQEFKAMAVEFAGSADSQAVEDEQLPEIEGIEQNTDKHILGRFLANVSLASDKQKDDKDGDGKPMITVSTIHSAKGLEWPVVFVPAVYKGSIPHVRSDDDAEERRLLYVAMTRAEALLYLSRPMFTSGGGSDALQLSPFVADIPAQNFLHKGPSLDREVMLKVAKLLRRDLPPDQDIYKGIPLLTGLEDDRFPIDPNEPKADNTRWAHSSHQGQKRPRLQQASSAEHAKPDTGDEWAAPRATTMDRATSFTIPSTGSAGFTTAGAHYAAEAVAQSARAAEKPKPQGVQRRPASNRAPSQKSLLGYGYGVTSHDMSKVTAESLSTSVHSQVAAHQSQVRPPWQRRQQRPQAMPKPGLPPAPQIEDGLASHKVGTARLNTKPLVGEKRDKAPDSYACFSSSPPRPEKSAVVVDGKENEPITEEDLTRPAVSFHATTVSVPTMGMGGGVRQGIKRPAPLGRSGITPMDRLKRPFKLTIKRP